MFSVSFGSGPAGRGRLGAAVLAASLLASGTASAGGFAIHEKSAKATTMGGAFVALSDDPSAMYYNPAGLVDVGDKDKERLVVMGGVTLIPFLGSFEGANPYPGQNYAVDMKTQIFFPPHLFAAYKASDRVSIGLGTWSPYGLSTAWEDPDTFRGRFLSQRVDLRVFALGLQASVKVTDWLSIGAGPELRIGDVKLQRNASAFNPFTQRVVDVAHVDVVGDGFQSKLTWAAGLMIKPCARLKFGASFHAHADIDFEGYTTFYPISTGNPQLDGAVAAGLPFGKLVPTRTTIQFPSYTQFGASYELTDKLTIAAAGDYTTWKVFDQTVLNFDTVDNKPVPASVLPHNWENTWGFRAGVSYQATPKFYVGAGYLVDQTPQPDEDVSPLLPDANRTGVSIGFGVKMGEHTSVEVGNLFLFFHERTTATNKDSYNGTYKVFADLFTFNLRTTF